MARPETRTPIEINEYIDGLVTAGNIEPEVANVLRAASLASYEEVDRAVVEAGGWIQKPEPRPGSEMTVEEERAEFDKTAAAEVVAALERAGQALAEDTEADPADIEAVVEAYGSESDANKALLEWAANWNANKDFNLERLRWMYSGEGGLVGQLGSVDIVDLAMFALETNPRITTDMLMYNGPGADRMSTSERFQRGAEEFFANANETTQTIVRQYGLDHDLFMSEEDRTAWMVSQQLGMTVGQARAFSASAKVHDMDPEIAAQIYKVQRDKGLVSEPWTAPQKSWTAADLDKLLYGGGEKDISRQGYGGRTGPRAEISTPARRIGVDEYGQSVAPGEEYVATPAVMFNRFQTQIDKYGSELVALVALSSPDLADRMYRDPYSLTAEEWTQVDDMIGGTGQWHGGSAASAAQASFIEQRMSGMKDVVRVDVDGAKEAARTLAASWNMPELSDSFLSHIASGTVAANLQAIRAAQGNPFRPSMGGPEAVNVPGPYAAAAKALRGTPEYQILFANLRSGESEEEYATRFDSAVNKFMGDTDPGLARAGMKSGSTATVGQAAMSSGAAYENSNFMDRLTQMGNAFKEAT